MNNKKRKRITNINPSKTPLQGIPKVLATIRYEKVSEVIPVKVQLSLKNCLKQLAGKGGVSAWVRGVILERLVCMTEEAN